MQSKTRSDWAVVVADRRKSGLSQKAFCDARGITPWKFSYWKARVEGAAPPMDFVELRPGPQPLSSGSTIELKISDNLEVHIRISALVLARALGINVPDR